MARPNRQETSAQRQRLSHRRQTGRGRAPDLLSGDWVTGAPDIVIEIGSPSTRSRDETIKRRLYDGSDVTEYWIVDPEIDVIRVYRRADAGFDRAVEVSAEAGDVLTTPLLPGLVIPAAQVFDV